MPTRRYVLQPGDTFYRLAKRWGLTCEDIMRANPGLNPVALQVGQTIILPDIKPELAGEQQYVEMKAGQGQEFAGERMDDMELEIEGVRFRIKRIGEARVPHEIHLLLPRTEIRKVQPAGDGGPCEVQIMISNVEMVHSPRLMSEGVDRAEHAERAAGGQRR